MSDKKIINMDDLMVDNLSLDNLVSLPNTPDASNDWKHKGESAPAVSVNAVDDLDISSVDLSVLDPERDVSESTYKGNTYFTPAPEETEQAAAPAAPAFVPPKGGITVEKFTPPTGGIEVGKISAPAAPSAPAAAPAPAPAPAPVPAPPRIEIPDPLEGMGLDLPPLKKVSVETPELPPIKPVSVEVPAPAPVAPVSVEIPELPPLKSVSAGKTADAGLPPVKKVAVEVPELPPLKPVTAEKPKAPDIELPPMKQPVTVGKTSDSDLPPLKQKSAEKKEDSSGLPPMKPVTVGKKTEAKPAEEDRDLIMPKNKKDDAPPPSDMSDVALPKLDDMMEMKTKVADFQKPEMAVNGGENPLANTNMSAARRKKLEEGFDAPVVMKQLDAATMQELHNNEMMERAEKGKTDVLVIAIIYIVLCAVGFISDLSVSEGIGFAIDVAFAVCLFKGGRRARLWYIVWGIISAVASWIGIAGIITLAKVGEITFTAMMWVSLITIGLESLFLLISSVMLLASKDIRAYFETL